MDLSEEGKIKFKPSRYWIKSMSSPNKWKDGDPRKGEKFFGLHLSIYLEDIVTGKQIGRAHV